MLYNRKLCRALRLNIWLQRQASTYGTMVFFKILIVWLRGLAFSILFASKRTIQAKVTILENLHVILEKTPRERDDIRNEVLQLLFNAFESTTIQEQVGR